MRRRAAAGDALLLVAMAGLAVGMAMPSGDILVSDGSTDALKACPAGPCPCLVLDGSVGADLASLAKETWGQFLAVFEARCGCFGDVRLVAARTLQTRAGYFPESATASVRVPATRAMLQSALVHEWAHHVEFQCASQQDLRPAFLAAQLLSLDTPWRADFPSGLAASELAETPSEQYAEAVVSLVLGGRPIPTGAHVTHAAVEAVREWAAGK